MNLGERFREMGLWASKKKRMGRDKRGGEKWGRFEAAVSCCWLLDRMCLEIEKRGGGCR